MIERLIPEPVPGCYCWVDSIRLSLVGESDDCQKLWLIAVDGKQPFYSEGVTLAELAKLQLLTVPKYLQLDNAHPYGESSHSGVKRR
ncbi:hypothetical protein [Coleofasciculus chthonoplastes]|jgi:hypothetical protein|uniref:hypothetical protein n=1 Tax=Coleofasciculus chthonoplastes TaxID=64178 RepID=UPI0032F9627F